MKKKFKPCIKMFENKMRNQSSLYGVVGGVGNDAQKAYNDQI